MTDNRPSPDWAKVRADFPRAGKAAYFDNASSHPISTQSAAALHRYVDWVTFHVGDPWWPDWAGERNDSKALFAQLIGAETDEISHARSTVEAESNLLNGMQHHLAGGNVVTSDLCFSANLYNYKMREQDGLDVRIVPNRDWRIDLSDMADAIDDDTRLVSVALVSNVNGLLADVAALAELAHARGAYLYVDIMQAAGAVPIDVGAMGIDMAACSTFKWLMGVKGFAYQYVRKELQGSVVRPMQHSGGVACHYPPWVDDVADGEAGIRFSPTTGPQQYEVSYPSYEGAICAQESLRYILELGVDNIRNHARELTDRLHKELPARGYAAITPPDNESPIVSFVTPDPQAARQACTAAEVHVAMRFGNKLRLAPSVFNDHSDIDRLLEALP